MDADRWIHRQAKDDPLQCDVGQDYEDTPAIVTVEVEFKAVGTRKK